MTTWVLQWSSEAAKLQSCHRRACDESHGTKDGHFSGAHQRPYRLRCATREGEIRDKFLKGTCRQHCSRRQLVVHAYHDFLFGYQEHYVLLLGAAVFLEIVGGTLFLLNFDAGAIFLVIICLTASQFNFTLWACHDVC